MRQFDTAMRNAIARNPVSIALAVDITRIDGKVIRFAQTPDALDLGGGGLFLPAAGVSLSSLPFELNGATTRFDMIVTATPGGTIEPQDIRLGLYDSALVSVYLMSREHPTLGNKLFSGSMGQMTLTERGYATIECVGLLSRASQLVTETYTPVCRADFGDARCKIDLAPLTYRCSVIGYDGGYVLHVAGLPGDALTEYVPPTAEIPGTSDIPPTLGTPATSATGTFRFTSYPDISTGAPSPIWIAGMPFYGNFVLISGLGGIYAYRTIPQILDWLVSEMQDVAYRGFLQFLNQRENAAAVSILRTLTFTSNGVDTITITAAPGSAGNGIALAVSPSSHMTASGPTLRGGQDATVGSPGIRGTASIPGAAGYTQTRNDFFKNGQVIFRSGLLLNEAYEVQSSDGPYMSLFTPTDFPPKIGDVVDVIVGCDHSPGPQGCSRFRTPESISAGVNSNILNYRGEPYCFSGATRVIIRFRKATLAERPCVYREVFSSSTNGS